MKKRSEILKKQKKGQVTIFIIVAIIVILLALLIYMFYPQIKARFGPEPENPSAYIQSCIEDEIAKSVQTLSSQGGSLNPEHYILYSNDKIEYLCYTEEYYKTCIMQQPMLLNHIEKEISKGIEVKSKECFNALEREYKGKGYDVNLKRGNISVELAPKRITVTFNNHLTLKKEATDEYESIKVSMNNNLYELVMIANSILNWEATYGNAETTAYMTNYHNLKVEKKKQTDGSTIYILTERDSKNKFQFASRSVAWPPGYGTQSPTL